MMSVSAIICAVSVQANSILAPAPMPLPTGMPGAVADQGGTYLPRPLDQAVATMLRHCQEEYRPLCQRAIDAGADAALASCPPPPRATDWRVSAVVAGVVGLVTGLLVGGAVAR